MITETPGEGDVPLVGDGVADVYVDPDDHGVVERAAEDLTADVERVTGARPSVVNGLDGSGAVVVVGTLGESAGVDACRDAADADLDALADERESFVVETLADPPVDADAAVLVAGSDRRGTAYGAYELGRELGVSPWYWWADVAPDQRETAAVEAGTHRDGPPDVTYRGVFLNDEDWGLRPWSSETHAPEEARDRDGVTPSTYERLFELLLRLRANVVWPAMHPGTKAFYRYDGIEALADEYAIAIGTSHCEPMHRNNVDEWEDAFGDWNYATNGDRILEYWRDRVERVADYENVFTVGMRGIHDSGMPGGDTREETTELLQRVLDDQRDLLDDAHDAPVADVPQVFCPYKEVLDLYRGGLDVPDDVCLMWPNDSHGYVRELPTPAERDRPGGSGIYYHLSYWGRPHDYLWLSSVPPAVVRHEMLKAYDAGARECWVVNVGDVKPTEKELEYFLETAWDVSGAREEPVESWLRRWAAREFDDRVADEVAAVLREYYRLCLARKPEHMGWSTVYPNTQPADPAFSATRGGDEAERRRGAFEDLVDRVETVRERLPESDHAALFELVEYPVRCAAATNEKYLAAARSKRYAAQGRASVDRHAARAMDAHEHIAALTERYDEVRDGKWKGMMSHEPRDLPVFDEPTTATVELRDGAALGVAIEGRTDPVSYGEAPPPSLPTIHAAIDRARFVDVFARGDAPVDWTAETDADWIALDTESGTVADECRLWVDVDWDAHPGGQAAGTVTVSGAGAGEQRRVRVRADARTPDGDVVAVDGVAAVEAEAYGRRTPGEHARWTACDVPGRHSGAAMALDPPVFESHDPEDAPTLAFDLDLPAGEATVTVYCLPTQALTADRDLRYAVTLGDDRRVVSIDPDGGEHDPEWQGNVLRGAAVGTSTHTVDGSGTLVLAGLDPGLVVDRIVVTVGGEHETYLGPRATHV
ncbi:glycosyl hydrolase 115 family protein [Halosimplex salinum]|uniref:glycosyl hydrolase 115 family protein n=1 Tax=Halosimplex salinum TaxID=1710538 RepID=UPI000F462BDA|nr:glycosyl hydrolase 115 family protein [Halosimplex salinum]